MGIVKNPLPQSPGLRIVLIVSSGMLREGDDAEPLFEGKNGKLEKTVTLPLSLERIGLDPTDSKKTIARQLGLLLEAGNLAVVFKDEIKDDIETEEPEGGPYSNWTEEDLLWGEHLRFWGG